jgi:hypothetical protein
MANQQTNDPNTQNQKGAPQQTADTPSSGNSPTNTGSQSGTDERTNQESDVERSGGSGGTATRRSPQTSGYGGAEPATGDPGRTPGKAEGVENPEKQGNE